MFGLMVGLGARGRGVDREEQASAIIKMIILSPVQPSPVSVISLINHVVNTENYNGSGWALIVPVSWSSSWGAELCFRFYQITQHRTQAAGQLLCPAGSSQASSSVVSLPG